MRWRSTSDEPLPFAGGEPLDPDDGTPLDPAVFGTSMRSLAFVAEPVPLQRLLGRALYALAGAVQWILQVVGGRYYLTGVFVAMILMLIVMVS